jgi:hypothetical protein
MMVRAQETSLSPRRSGLYLLRTAQGAIPLVF